VDGADLGKYRSVVSGISLMSTIEPLCVTLLLTYLVYVIQE